MKPGEIIKTFTSKKGNVITMRTPMHDDIDQILAYANNLIAEDTYVLISGKPITRREEMTFLNDRLKNIEKDEEISIIVEINKTVCGMAGIAREKYRSHHVGIPGISIAGEYRGEGIGKVLFQTLIDESKKLGLRLLMLHCFENNVCGLHLYESLGFKKTGVIPEAILFKGSYIGQIVMYLPLV
ncbi:MAG TPA: GNAT family N-acetyltransferase [Patescibacteria group bacterium]|nr:GNAT family N-acetyltransferase [Patescibacteria group bacterium]